MTQEQHEFLDERDLNKYVAGSDAKKEHQRNEAFTTRWDLLFQEERRQADDDRRSQQTDPDESKQNRERRVYLEIRSSPGRAQNELPEVPRLDGIEEERAVIRNGADIKGIALVEAVDI